MTSQHPIVQDSSWDFPLASLRWRIQSTNQDKTRAQYIAYPDARDVAEKLDEVFGWNNWRDSYDIFTEGKQPFAICSLSVRDGSSGDWITKHGVGHATDIETWKGAESDAFKRAAAKLGIGRNVYGFPPVWGDTEVKYGKAFMPKGYEAHLRKECLRLMAAGASSGISESAQAEERESEPAIGIEQWEALVAKMGALSEADKGLLREKWSSAYDFDPVFKSMTEASFEDLNKWVMELLDLDPVDAATELVVGALGGEVVE